MSKDISIIIPHRGDPGQLYFTIQAVQEDLSHSEIDYDFLFYTNGGPVDRDTERIIHMVEQSGRLGGHLHSDDNVAPPTARQRAAQQSSGKVLFFFDSHCIVNRDYFRRVLLDMEKDPEIDVLHSSTKFFYGDKLYYEYVLNLDYNFWAGGQVLPQFAHKPYRVAAAGHGGFAVKKELWDFVGGYGPDGLFVGYGGEELIFDLKVWMYGRSVHIDPKLIHYHYPGSRGYSRHYTDDYYINMMISANVIGGEEWLYKVFESFSDGSHLRVKSDKTMMDLLQISVERSQEYAQEVKSRSVRTLDEQLDWFRLNDVPM